MADFVLGRAQIAAVAESLGDAAELMDETPALTSAGPGDFGSALVSGAFSEAAELLAVRRVVVVGQVNGLAVNAGTVVDGFDGLDATLGGSS